MIINTRPSSHARPRPGVMLTFALAAMAAVFGVASQGGGEPVSAQTGSPQAGQPCAPADTQKTTICHVPLGHPEQAQTSCVANSAVKSHLANHAGDCVGGCPCAQRVTYSTCAPVTVTRLHGEGFAGNSRIARIEGGKVGCLHAETGEKAECLFSTDGASPSGKWVEAADGHYAKTGQAITLQGVPGGDWVVAARVSDAGTVPCVAPSGQDTAGLLVEGTELATTCVVEDVNQEYNVLSIYSFAPLVNYTDIEVCSVSNPHPDNAQLTRTVTLASGATAYCYTGVGAALNDINGTERASTGLYLTETEHCHMIVTSGYEVPAAKRPATRSLPAPGSVNFDSFIAWRPVNTNFDIANAPTGCETVNCTGN